MSDPTKYRVHGQVTLKGAPVQFRGDEILYIFVRDTLRYDAECIELGSTSISLRKGQAMPVTYQCSYDPDKAHMRFEEIKTIPGGVTLSASIERNGQLLYKNDTDLPLAEQVNIQLVAIE